MLEKWKIDRVLRSGSIRSVPKSTRMFLIWRPTSHTWTFGVHVRRRAEVQVECTIFRPSRRFELSECCIMNGDCTGWDCRVSDASRRTIPAGDARLSTWRHLHVYVDAVHRRILDCISYADNRRTGQHFCLHDVERLFQLSKQPITVKSQIKSVDVERGNGDGAEFWVRSVLHPTHTFPHPTG